MSRVHSLSAILKNVDSNTRTLRGSAVNSVSKGQLNTQYNFPLEKVTVTQTSLENVHPNKTKDETSRNLEIKVETKKANNRTPNRL